MTVSGARADPSGICDDHIANDGYQKICLEKDRVVGLGCDVDRQCFVSLPFFDVYHDASSIS